MSELLSRWRDVRSELTRIETALAAPGDEQLLADRADLEDELEELQSRIDGGELDESAAIEYLNEIQDDDLAVRDFTGEYFTRYPRFSWEQGRELPPGELGDGTFAGHGARPGYPRLVEGGVLPPEVNRRHLAQPIGTDRAQTGD